MAIHVKPYKIWEPRHLIFTFPLTALQCFRGFQFVNRVICFVLTYKIKVCFINAYIDRQVLFKNPESTGSERHAIN